MDVLEVLQAQLRFRHHGRDQLIVLKDVDRGALAAIGTVQRADDSIVANVVNIAGEGAQGQAHG